MTSASVTDAAAVLDAEGKRFAAMTQGDLEALKKLLDDDLTYTHTTGRTETKEEFLDALRTGALRYVAIDPEDVRVRTYDGVAVVNGTSAMHVQGAGQDHRFRIRYLAVYRRRRAGWRMVAWQSVRLPEG